MRCAILISALIAVAAPVAPAGAWWDEGHMQIAHQAYDKYLDGAAKEKVDALLMLHHDYKKWTDQWPDKKKKLYAFMHAATWADDIKMDGYRYGNDPEIQFKNDKATCPTDESEDIGYKDGKQHRCWHFKDIAFSPDGTPWPPPAPVDAVRQLNHFIRTLRESSDADKRSYALVWILHLAGDLHQPLHAASRYTRLIPGADDGGNVESVIPATGVPISLHFYWDGIFGGYSSPFGAEFDAGQNGLDKITPNPILAQKTDPQAWADESLQLAVEFAYARPVGTRQNPPVFLTREYETNARNLAYSQAALAAARLANILNAALK